MGMRRALHIPPRYSPLSESLSAQRRRARRTSALPRPTGPHQAILAAVKPVAILKIRVAQAGVDALSLAAIGVLPAIPHGIAALALPPAPCTIRA